jgi:nucleotide-binding universal stress UspA family protein
MYKRILVPTDGSATARLGLLEALKLAAEQRAQLLIVHVIDELLTIAPEAYGAVYDRVAEQLRATGTALLATCQKLATDAGVTAETQLIEALGGVAGDRIIRAAKEWSADLIVCGTHGRRGLRRILMGSDAEYILRHSPVPVLMLRDPEHHG